MRHTLSSQMTLADNCLLSSVIRFSTFCGISLAAQFIGMGVYKGLRV